MNKIKILKCLIGVCCVMLLVQGVIWAYLLFFGGRYLRGIWLYLEEFTAQSSTVVIAIYISATIILLKLIASQIKIHPRRYYAVAIIGFTIAGLNSSSLLATPYTIWYAENEFTQVFGDNWENEIPEDIKADFLQTQYVLPANFLEIPEKPIKEIKHVLYYSGEGIRLHFDAYLPVGDVSKLPGKGSTIINLHPGGWVSGGKGTWNMITTSKYLASQGYVVFDIQYGLIAGNFSHTQSFDTPEYVKGDFTIEDQLRHVGIFTKRLESTYAWRYGARLDSVYLMGRSAGAQLACTMGYGYNEEFHKGTFSRKLTIKGIIALYPPSGAPSMLLEGQPDTSSIVYKNFLTSYIADPEDPPMIIFQGTSDGQVWIERVEVLESEIELKGAKCCLLKFPFAGHAQDFVINSNIGQVWTYYLERFLYLTQ
ncbi:MAG: hypothetical protein ACTSRI_19090 [Promethearchaeota archaeon]